MHAHIVQEDLTATGLAKVIKVKEGTLTKLNFDNYAKDVEAILINPKWNTT